MRRTFIAWVAANRHSELLAQQLGATFHPIRWNGRGWLATPLRYLVQAATTWRVLRRERPDVVFVQSPPVFAVLAIYVYARLHRARYVVSAHTGAFLSPRWRWSLPLHAWLSRRAATTIVHNRDLEPVVRGWRARALVLGFVPGEYPLGPPFPFERAGFNAAVVSTLSEDEPLDVLFEAAGRLPDVDFYVTGRVDRLAAELREKLPPNCRLTGFLLYGSYVSLLRGADLVVDLTTRDHTVLLGVFEAVSLGTPVLTSDWPILREYFHPGVVHVANTVEGIGDGVRRAQRNIDVLRREVLILRRRLDDDWERAFAELRRAIDDEPDAPQPHLNVLRTVSRASDE